MNTILRKYMFHISTIFNNLTTEIIKGTYWNYYELELNQNLETLFQSSPSILTKNPKLLWKVQFDNGTIISVSFLQIVNKSQFNELLVVFKSFLDKKVKIITEELLLNIYIHITILKNKVKLKLK